jgi:dTDP-4-dehydrorhamnose reductase
MKKNIILFGASGFLGKGLVNYLNLKFNIYGIKHKSNCSLPKEKIFTLHLSNFNKLTKQLIAVKPKIIIHAAGLTDIERCESKKILCYKTNVELTKKIVRISNKICSKLIYISSDHLYDGKSSFYKEKQKTSPLNYYAKTKVYSENFIRKNCKKFLIIRTNFFDKSINKSKKNFLYFIFRELTNKNYLKLFKDVFYTPVSIKELSRIISRLINLNASGVFNIASNKRLSKYEFGNLVAKKYKLNKDLIFPIYFYDTNLTRRPLDMSLSNSKIKNLKIKIKSLDTQIQETLK